MCEQIAVLPSICKLAMIPGMSEESDELQKQIDELREDLKLLIRHSAQAQKDITAWADQSGEKGFVQEEVKRCKEFKRKYPFRIG
jgi:hypothetical protein